MLTLIGQTAGVTEELPEAGLLKADEETRLDTESKKNEATSILKA